MFYAILLILVLYVLAMVADHKKDKRQKLKIVGLENHIGALNEKVRQKDNQILDYIAELDACGRVSEQRHETIKMQAAQIAGYKDRLANAVEGLGSYENEVLRALKNNEYIYDVHFPDGVSTAVNVPIDSKYPDYVAKRKAGAKSTDMKNVKAVRWTI